MGTYLANAKEIIDQIKDVDVGLPKTMIIYHTLKNLSTNFNMIK